MTFKSMFYAPVEMCCQEAPYMLSICKWFFSLFQAHLEGLFDNVKTVDFHEKNYDQILAISSRENEKIDLTPPVMAQVSF